MKTVRLACFVLITVLLPFSILGCTEKYDYPDGLTNEYFYTNYVPMDYNYMFASVYDNALNDGQAHYVNGKEYRFYAITDESIDQYVACTERSRFFNSDYKYTVYTCDSNGIEPIANKGIYRVSIMLKKNNVDMEKIISYEKSSTAKEIQSTNNKVVCDSLKQSISNKDGYIKRTSENLDLDLGPGSILYCTDEEYLNTLLCIRVYTPSTDNIFWESNIVLYEGHYCLASYRSQYRDFYDLIPLSDEVSDYIKNVVEQSGYTFAYERVDQ